MTAPLETEEDDTDHIERYVEKARGDKVPDDEIYTFLNDKGAFKSYQEKATEAGISERDQRHVIGDKLKIDTRKKPTLLQSALQYMAGPIPIIGNQLGIKSLKELENIPGGALSGAISAPRNVLDFPTLLSEASLHHRYPDMPLPTKNPTKTGFGEFNPEQGYVPPDIENLFEPGDIGPILRALLPSGQQAHEALIAENAEPETMVGQGALRMSQFAGGGALGGAPGATIGGLTGLVDYTLEQQGFSPEARAILDSLVGLKSFTQQRPTPGIVPTEVLPAGPTGVSNAFNKWRKNTLSRVKSDFIDSTSDLAAKVFVRDPENINFQTINDLKQLGFDLEDVPIQAYTKGGLPNWLEGAQENALWGGKRYDSLMGQFTEGMTNRAEAILDTIPIEDINEEVSQQTLGAPQFENYVRSTLVQLAPNLNIDRATIGKLGTDAIESMDVSLKKHADSLYNQAKFTDQDFIAPSSKSYTDLKGVVAAAKKKLGGEGFIGAEREAALRVIDDIEKLFEEKETGGTQILGPDGQPFEGIEAEPLIKYEDLRKNLQALNSTLSYDKPGVINLLEPISSKIREIFRDEATTNPKVGPFLQAQEVFGQRARWLSDPKIRKFYNMDNEQFYQAMKRPSNLEAFKDFAEKTGNEAAYDMLRGGLLAKELGPALEATTPQELQTKLSDNLIERIRDIQRFYPEYPDFANGLSKARNNLKKFGITAELERSAIRKELIETQITGEAPSHTLKVMDTPKGIDFVKKTLSNTEQGKKFFNTLSRKKLEQVIYGKAKKTNVDMADVAKIFKDPNTDAIVQSLLSKDNYNQMKTLASVAESLQKGKSVSPRLKRQFDKILYSTGGMAVLGTIVGLGSAPVPGVGAIGLYILSRAALSPNFRKSIAEQIKQMTPNP